MSTTLSRDGTAATPRRRRSEPSTGRSGGRTARPWRRAARLALRAGLALVLAAAAAAFLFLAVGPRFLGYQTSTMLTGSMAPLINPGDVVVSVKTPTAQLAVGDIITYRIPVDDQRVETHRVVEVTRNPAGATAVRTKGDANNGADPWAAVITDDSVYTTKAVIPHLGDVIRALRSPSLRLALVVGAPMLVVGIALSSIWRRPPGASREEGENRGAP
ncbi:signal peptidase I [Sinomonas atrocyanea]|uniref:signal peptidase I n=1 Tax=Sinomonas atrocyanea TaxID=37927 RepID=UPI0028549CBC|nr:signal peptidase I [Sinomonas atrocyanea]MDR6622416.1 signal peptidase [Sinomonas atrocyanea]